MLNLDFVTVPKSKSFKYLLTYAKRECLSWEVYNICRVNLRDLSQSDLRPGSFSHFG